jgi:hypothetical protein
MRPEPLKLRCVGISPRLVWLIELEASDWRYHPYGGDKEASRSPAAAIRGFPARNIARRIST